MLDCDCAVVDVVVSSFVLDLVVDVGGEYSLLWSLLA